MYKKTSKTIAFMLVLLLSTGSLSRAKPFHSPDILVLGDSQITFGAGPAYLNFFENLGRRCARHLSNQSSLRPISRARTAVIGVRATSFQHWTSRDNVGKSKICDQDPVLKRNAGAYGTVNRARQKYVQIGIGQDFQFCKSNRSPIETALSPGYYRPKLVVLSFLGNAVERWTDSPDEAVKDLSRLLQQLPATQRCVIMTTSPSYKPKVNQRRLLAQKNLERAIIKTGNRCAFVPGLTPTTLHALRASPHNFRINADGTVKDPFHPTHKGAEAFFNGIEKQICTAIQAEMSGSN